MKTVTGCIVLQGGKPCTLWNAAVRNDTKRGGVLVLDVWDSAQALQQVFDNEQQIEA